VAQAMTGGGAAAIPARGSPDLAREEALGEGELTSDRFWPETGRIDRRRAGPVAWLLGGRWSSAPAKGAAPAVQKMAPGDCVGLCEAVRALGQWW
jgi:hypothetical protein